MTYLFKLKTISLYILLAGIVISCSKEEEDLNDQLKISNATAITNNDMYGHWILSGMIADVEIDLDDDMVSSKNLLEETSCFDNMYITFRQDGTFNSNNAQMTFESGTAQDEFSCLADRKDNGAWEVRNDSLILNLQINSTTYIHKKLINLGTDKFSLDVTKIESDQYVTDPGNTQASPIRILELEYTRI
ncbi:DUF5004 domain-containing protein [Christiangramia sabulilitoris]|uniref:DUF5004 domain-containing protein n=1 Tax=Christiangramia sabulilitoris TaxID=2583991 RepID=A0A550I031_9FLAO|nr:DUF5004 domain-containing protein [Christiangramia sabulilitoris]TRO64290.1 DUF5004 domain-containing protein [Christiangramia sabulilitoris]